MHRRLGRPLPHQLPNVPQAHRLGDAYAEASFQPLFLNLWFVWGISQNFFWLSPSKRQVTYVLLTRAPLYSSRKTFAFDLHVLSILPAFVLSQDQTLQASI